jgi:hypothetical protein
VKAYQDSRDPRNGAAYRTGRPCVERGCENEAGTAWSPLWCHPCNVKRMDRIGASLEDMVRELEKRSTDGVKDFYCAREGSCDVTPRCKAQCAACAAGVDSHGEVTRGVGERDAA